MIVHFVDVGGIVDHHCLNVYSSHNTMVDSTIYKVDVNYLSH